MEPVAILVAIVVVGLWAVVQVPMSNAREAQAEALRQQEAVERARQQEKARLAAAAADESARLAAAAAAESARKEAAMAQEARMSEFREWPLDRLKWESEDVRSRMHAKQREYDTLWAEYNRVMDDVADEQQDWLRRTGSLSSKDCPDANEVSRYWDANQLGPVRRELEALKQRDEDISSALRDKWK